MTAILLASGVTSAPREILPPAPDGMVGLYEFDSTTAATAMRNLRNAAAPLTIRTTLPTFAGGYAAFDGSYGQTLITGLSETLAFGLLAMVRVPGGATNNHRIFNNYTSAGTSLFFTSNSRLNAYTTTETGQYNSGTLDPVDLNNWQIVSLAMSATGSRRLRNLSAGTSLDAQLASRGVLATVPFVLGGAAINPGSLPAGIQIRTAAITLGRQPSDAEMDANARMMQARAAAVGITVALA